MKKPQTDVLDLYVRHARLDDAEAGLFTAVAHPVRIKILHAIADEELSAAKLAERLRVPHGTIAEHLHHLWHAGVVTSERGIAPKYRLSDPRLLDAFTVFRTVASTTGGAI